MCTYQITHVPIFLSDDSILIRFLGRFKCENMITNGKPTHALVVFGTKIYVSAQAEFSMKFTSIETSLLDKVLMTLVLFLILLQESFLDT